MLQKDYNCNPGQKKEAGAGETEVRKGSGKSGQRCLKEAKERRPAGAQKAPGRVTRAGPQGMGERP